MIPSPDIDTTVQDWWAKLQRNPRDRAMLRRSESVSDIFMIPAFHQLVKALACDSREASQLAPAAAVLSHVVQEPAEPRSLGATMAGGKGERVAVSDLRFRRVIQCHDRADLIPALRRILPLVGGVASVGPLARDIFFWGNRVQERWAMDYYQSAT